MIKESYDIIIIGAGPGGYVAAIRAAQLKQKVLVIEKSELGGVCLNWGCIPTKALLRSSEILNNFKNGNKFGIESDAKFSLDNMVNRSRNVSKRLSDGIAYLFKKHAIEYKKGNAIIKNNNTVSITNKGNSVDIEFKSLIIATGAKPKIPVFLEKHENVLWDYKNAMVPDILPKDLGIIGSGAIGIEFASFYNDLGVKVDVFELKSRICPNEDKEVSVFLEKALTKKGVSFYKNYEVTNFNNKDKMELLVSNNSLKKTFSYDRVLIAIGVQGNTDKLGIENTKIKVNNNQIITYEFGKTDENNIYAIGDVAGLPWLAHKASHEGIACVEHIAKFKNTHSQTHTPIPSCIYSNPQVASIGLTEEQAILLKKQIKIGKFPLSANGKALALGDSEGFIKTIFDKDTGEILGAHMIGPEVTELINTFSLAIKLEATEEDIINTIFPHPTLSESIHESVLDAFDRAIHI